MNELYFPESKVIILNEHKVSSNKYFQDIFERLPVNSQRSFKSDIKQFGSYCDLNNLPGLTPNIQDNEECIKSYLEAMCKSQLSYNTIMHRLSTLSKSMSIAKLPDPLKQSEYLRDFIKLEIQAHDIYNRANQAPALRLSMINQMNKSLDITHLLNLRDLALINIMFDGLLRADEVTSIQLKHIDAKENSLLIPKSKTDQSGKGSLRFISDTSIYYVNEYLKLANTCKKTKQQKPKNDLSRINKGILFRSLSPKGTSTLSYDETITRVKEMKVLNYTTVYRVIKRLALNANVDLKLSGHSPRVGGAVTMAEENIPINKIKDAGGWKTTEMPARYTEQANVESGMGELAKKFNR